ncbi:MAG: hypothetical protein AB7L90_13390 [Hyphomicrobiaceae bacterium]
MKDDNTDQNTGSPTQAPPSGKGVFVILLIFGSLIGLLLLAGGLTH